MNKKRIALVAALTTLFVILSNVSMRADSGADAAATLSDHERRDDTARQQTKTIEADGTLALQPNNKSNKSALLKAVSATSESSWKRKKNLEALLVDIENGSLNATRIHELGSDSYFDELAAQLRDQISGISNEKRRKYELLFYSPTKSRDGKIAMDTLECGNYLCVVELRADDKAVLDAYIEDVTRSDAFEAGAILNFPGSEIYSTGESRRILFSHDPNVNAVTLPDMRLASDQL